MKDPEYLFAILATIVKKNGGLLRLTQEEIEAADQEDEEYEDNLDDGADEFETEEEAEVEEDEDVQGDENTPQ